MMEPISLDELNSAAATIEPMAVRTPVISDDELNRRLGCTVHLKMEGRQRAGSFKFRGAFNRLSSIPADERARGVVAVSSGNHGAAVASAARLLELPAVVFIPDDAPAAKRTLIEQAGAEVVTFDRIDDDREALARARVAETGATFIHPFEDRLVMAGQGTAAMELHHQVGPLQALLVPVSGGGLMAGSASAMQLLDPDCQLFGVEPELGDDTRRSMLAGRPVTIDQPSTMADGLAVTSPGPTTFAINQRLVSEILTVSEQQIAAAMALLWETLGVMVEASGAVGVAALMAHQRFGPDQQVGLIISGGNIDRELFERLTGTV